MLNFDSSARVAEHDRSLKVSAGQCAVVDDSVAWSLVSTTAGGLTILRTMGGLLATKRWTWRAATQCWLKKSYDKAARFSMAEVNEMTGIDDLAEAVRFAASDPRQMIIRGALSDSAQVRIVGDPNTRVTRRKRARGGIDPDFIEVARQWLMIDIDNFQMRAHDDLADDPESAIQYAIEEVLPSSFQEVRCFWQLSSSAGFERGVLKVHLFYWLSEPIIDAVLKKTLKQHAPGITDLSVYQGVQPHYVVIPIIEGGPDPIPRRFGWIKGAEDAVTLPPLHPDEPRRPAAGKAHIGGHASCPGGDPLERLGDGPGLDGFHLPLRSACWAYAVRVRRFGERDDWIAARSRRPRRWRNRCSTWPRKATTSQRRFSGSRPGGDGESGTRMTPT
jgi:hypothetical protein